MLGAGSVVDKQALVGYKPSRPVKKLTLNIGKNALIRSGTIVYLGSRIGDGFETGHNVIVREENSIGNGVRIWSNTTLDYRCKIGNNVKIHSNCYISQLTIIEDDVFLAPGVMTANEKHPTGAFGEGNVEGPLIKRGSRLGMGSIIMPGLTIGEGAVIGAGAVVTKSIAKNSIAYGVPASLRGRADKA